MSAKRKSIFMFLHAALIAAVSLGSAWAQGTQAEGVKIFAGRDGVGMSQDIPVGTFQVDGIQLSSSDDKGPNASVKVAKDYFVRFCAQKDGSGRCEEYGEGIHNLISLEFNFIKVWNAALTERPRDADPSGPPVSAPVTVFEQKNWGGRTQMFGPGMYRSFRGEFGKINDNQARSVIVAKGFRARFCSDEGLNFRGSGDCEIHEEGRHNLRFANSISFIEVSDLAENAVNDEKMAVILYEDPSQAGKMQGFDIGTFLASRGQFRKIGNDQASSIAVKDGYRASVCADEPAFGGEAIDCEEFGPGRKNLKNR
ncbi:MAG: hypothetical protein ABI857_05165, partial [Acidobacteriota bacterium]